ncbi:MAG: hypothetical protein AAF604_15520 [Acidobacteriota bacterium]
MNDRRFGAAMLATFLLTTALAFPAGGKDETRSKLAASAEEAFFTAFVQRPEKPEAALPTLTLAWLRDRDDGRTQLLLGLNHLWLAAEGSRADPRTIEHLLLAERFLAMAAESLPEDRRIPSWLVPARLFLATGDEQKALVGELEAAYREDPVFHSFTMALLGFDQPVSSPAFQRGLEALRLAGQRADLDGDDPSAQNRPHWPHNVEGFLTFWADYELKAGHQERSHELLLTTRATESFERWPYREEVEDRLANLELYGRLYANDDPADDPPGLFGNGSQDISCQACHRGS